VQAQAADDSVQHILDLPMVSNPGENWTYNSGGSHLLGAIVTEATGTPLLDYAMEKLFDPLGIQSSDIIWPKDNQGLYWGHGGVSMVPRDMAKFGFLYLNNGSWDGEQIISTEWVQKSSETLYSFDEFGGYSYQWWTYPSDIVNVYAAQGFAGQFIFVIPSLDLVVVFTSNVPPYEAYPHTAILFNYIIPAAINEISGQVIIANTVTLSVFVMILLPVFFLGSKYRLRIGVQFHESTIHQELIQS
jgi:CubicO group peptidase (beta-lactamase class C family)